MNFAIYEQADKSPEVKQSLFTLNACAQLCELVYQPQSSVGSDQWLCHLFKGEPWTSETEM